jgi:hypothetical protein
VKKYFFAKKARQGIWALIAFAWGFVDSFYRQRHIKRRCPCNG